MLSNTVWSTCKSAQVENLTHTLYDRIFLVPLKVPQNGCDAHGCIRHEHTLLWFCTDHLRNAYPSFPHPSRGMQSVKLVWIGLDICCEIIAKLSNGCRESTIRAWDGQTFNFSKIHGADLPLFRLVYLESNPKNLRSPCPNGGGVVL